MSHRAELLRHARSDDPAAQFAVACDYDFNPPKRTRLAIQWYLKAAEQKAASLNVKQAAAALKQLSSASANNRG